MVDQWLVCVATTGHVGGGSTGLACLAYTWGLGCTWCTCLGHLLVHQGRRICYEAQGGLNSRVACEEREETSAICFAQEELDPMTSDGAIPAWVRGDQGWGSSRKSCRRKGWPEEGRSVVKEESNGERESNQGEEEW